MSSQRQLVVMHRLEVARFLHESRTAAVSTLNRDGSIHSIAMWYGFIGETIAISTRVHSQKARNIARNPNTTMLIESGCLDYDHLKGVQIVGTADPVQTDQERMELGRSLFSRYVESGSEPPESLVATMVENRLLLKVRPTRVVSWDHSKLPPRGQLPDTARRLRLAAD